MTPTHRSTRTMTFVLAGGEGTRLRPLTNGRCKPAVPFNGRLRIVDFVLSNLENSGLGPAHVLVQHQAQELEQHLRARDAAARAGGRASHHLSEIIRSRPGRDGAGRFLGTADAILKNLHRIEREKPDLVAIFSADHVYRMDVRQMIDEHLTRGAEVTIATVPVPLSATKSFGIVQTDDALWVRGFREKPEQADPMPGRSGCALASMGNYVFSAEVLVQELREALARGETDFGSHVLPRLVGQRRMLAYDFTVNYVPGLADFEDPWYWRDVGTIDAYHEAQLDTLGPVPKFRLANPEWPIHAAAASVGAARLEDAVMARSVVSARCVVRRARLNDSMLRQDVSVNPHAQLDRSLVMDHCSVGRGTRLRRVIVDRHNFVPDGEAIGIDLDRDSGRFHVSEGGIVVVPEGYFAQSRSLWQAAA